MCIIILFLVLTVAAITDLLFDKIYNEWLLGAMAAGLILPPPEEMTAQGTIWILLLSKSILLRTRA